MRSHKEEREAAEQQNARERQEWAAKSSEEKAQFYLEDMGATDQAISNWWGFRETHAAMATIHLLQALNEKIDRLLEVRKD